MFDSAAVTRNDPWKKLIERGLGVYVQLLVSTYEWKLKEIN